MPKNRCATILGTLLLLGCSSETTPLRIYAAVSMTPVVEHLLKENPPEYAYEFNSASSSVLAQQIAQGAPADLFLSASPQWSEFLSQKKQIDRSWQGIGNAIVLIKTKNSPIDCDVSNPSTLAIADWTHVPAGIYAKQALEQLQLFSVIKERLIPAIHVHAVLSYVARGDVPCGIVYKSDTIAHPEVEIVPSPLDSLTIDIRYAFALLTQHTHPEAENLYSWLLHPTHKSTFEQFGFFYIEEEP